MAHAILIRMAIQRVMARITSFFFFFLRVGGGVRTQRHRSSEGFLRAKFFICIKRSVPYCLF